MYMNRGGCFLLQRQLFGDSGTHTGEWCQLLLTPCYFVLALTLHVDATIMRSFQTELFSTFLPSAYSGHVNLAATKPWQFMPKYRDGDTVEFNIFRV